MATIPLRPCKIFENCPPDSPIDNFSSESDDPVDYFSHFYGGNSPGPPRLGTQWSSESCDKVFFSTVSQQDADWQAQQAAELCLFNPGDKQYFNKDQKCQIRCPDGQAFTFDVPAGVFPGRSQAEADALALAVACKGAAAHQICISSIPDAICVNQLVKFPIVASGKTIVNSGNTWSLTGGALPVGMSLVLSHGNTILLTGTPTLPGLYGFIIGLQTTLRESMFKVFALCVVDINPPTLPAGKVGTAYSQPLGTACAAVLSWKVVSGALPPGLTLNASTGMITGTPTTAGTYNFTIGLTAI